MGASRPSNRSFTVLLLTPAILAWLSSAAAAGPVVLDTWYEFGFSGPGISATGCLPADPAGPPCVASIGTPTQFLDPPPWTFTLTDSALFLITDAFDSGDQFEVLNFGIPFLMTSLPAPLGAINCGSDPVPCLATAGMSTGSTVLPAGAYSLTIAPLQSPSGTGAAYFGIFSIPEPGTLLLLTTGLAVAGWRRVRRGV